MRQTQEGAGAWRAERQLGRTVGRKMRIWDQHDLSDDTAFAEQLMGGSCLREWHARGNDGPDPRPVQQMD